MTAKQSVVDFRKIVESAGPNTRGAAVAAAAGFDTYKAMWAEAERLVDYCFRHRLQLTQRDGAPILVGDPAFHRPGSMPAPRALTRGQQRQHIALLARRAYEEWAASAPHSLEAEPLHRARGLEVW